MLHALLLGIFMTVRDTFFNQIGAQSDMSDQLNNLACEYGTLLSRQSDRALPSTRFYGGIRRGKLQAKEFTGVLLVVLCAISSGKGQTLLKKKPSFKEVGIIDGQPEPEGGTGP